MGHSNNAMDATGQGRASLDPPGRSADPLDKREMIPSEEIGVLFAAVVRCYELLGGKPGVEVEEVWQRLQKILEYYGRSTTGDEIDSFEIFKSRAATPKKKPINTGTKKPIGERRRIYQEVEKYYRSTGAKRPMTSSEIAAKLTSRGVKFNREHRKAVRDAIWKWGKGNFQRTKVGNDIRFVYKPNLSRKGKKVS